MTLNYDYVKKLEIKVEKQGGKKVEKHGELQNRMRIYIEK